MRHQLPHVRPSEGPSRDRFDGDPQAPHASASSGRWLVKQVAWVGAVSVLVLSACTVDEPGGATSSASVAASSQQSATPAETSPEDTPIVVVPVEPAESSGATAEPGRSEPVPDAALAAQMVCEPISRATRLSHESRWGPVDWDEAVQIAVGEGLTAGINWWVVVATPDGATGRARLTNADSLDDPEDAEWLIASGSQASTGEGMASNDSYYWQYFPHVKWDAAGHQRLHAAVAKGFECLDLEYPEPDPLNR